MSNAPTNEGDTTMTNLKRNTEKRIAALKTEAERYEANARAALKPGGPGYSIWRAWSDRAADAWESIYDLRG